MALFEKGRTGKFEVKSNFEIKDADEKKGIVTGYCSVFGNVDSDGDMIMPGAYAKTLVERGCSSSRPRIKHLWQHSSFEPIGVPIVLEEQEKGLYFETQFGRDAFSQDKLMQHIDKIITELSIGYNTVRQEDVVDGNGKTLHRKLWEVKLWEYSSVTWGSNSLTEVISAKGEVKEIQTNLNKRLDALNNGLKNGRYTDETCEQFEAEILKIKAIIESLKISEEPITAITPEIIKPTSEQILMVILKSLKS